MAKPDVHRAINVVLDDDVHDLVHDPGRPKAERAQALLDSLTETGEGLGHHWTTDEKMAPFFHGYNSHGPHTTNVIFHAAHPEDHEIITDPGWREEHEVNDSEDEVPVHRGAEMEIKGLSWKRHGDKEFTRHDFSDPDYYTASLKSRGMADYFAAEGLFPSKMGNTLDAGIYDYFGGGHGGTAPERRVAGRGKPRRDGGNRPAAPGGDAGGAPADAGRPQAGPGGPGVEGPRPVTFHPKAAKELAKLDGSIQKRAKGVVDALSQRGGEGVQTHALANSLAGYYSSKINHDHRIVHQSTPDGGIHIIYVGLHDYDQAARRTGALSREPGPVRFPYLRNTESSGRWGNFGDTFGQDVEPHGRYLTYHPYESKPDSPHWETGEVSFKNPLHMDFGPDDYSDPGNWKRQLSAQFGGKKGKALSRAVVKAGHDAIITHDESGPREIVDLTSFQSPRKRAVKVAKRDVMQVAPYLGDTWHDSAAEDFRRVVFTSPLSQFTVMTLQPGEEIGAEVHEDVDQILMLLSGQGRCLLNEDEMPFTGNAVLCVPRGNRHNVMNGDDGPMRLATVYAPAHHAPGTVHHTKDDAKRDKTDEYHKTAASQQCQCCGGVGEHGMIECYACDSSGTQEGPEIGSRCQRPCPCGLMAEHDPIDGWQHLDGSVTHDDPEGTSVSDLMKTAQIGEEHYDPDEGEHVRLWDRWHPQLQPEMHRHLSVHLPGDHPAHDDRMPMHERAHAVFQQVSEGTPERPGALGWHWTDDPSLRFLNTGEGRLQPGHTPVIVHAKTPPREHIEDNTWTLREDRAVKDWDHPEREVPLKRNAPVHITGISWQPVGKRMVRYDFEQPIVRQAAHPLPTSRVFGPTYGLDHRLFTGEKLKPEVRTAVMARLGPVIEPVLGDDWQRYTKVYLAGSEASEWTSATLEGNGDFDTLIGVDYDHLKGEPGVPVAHLDDQDITDALNKALREDYNASPWKAPFGGEWDLTGYCNAGSYDITRIKPYAAYNITDDQWAVRPPHLPDWSIDKLPEGGQNLLAEAEGYAAVIEAISKMPEPFQTQQGKALWHHLHSDRGRAFSDEGEGWYDPGNLIEKALVEWGLWDKLVDWQYGKKTASYEGVPVAHVRVDKLWPYREWDHQPGGYSYDREGGGPYAGKYDAQSWERNRQSVAEGGIEHPITLEYNPKAHSAYIGEGNHRLHWARELGHETVPVRVWRTSKDMHPRYNLPGAHRLPRGEHIPQELDPRDVLPEDWFPGQEKTAGARGDLPELTFKHLSPEQNHPYGGADQDTHTLHAYTADGQHAGELSWFGEDGMIRDVGVPDALRRRGVASELLRRARQIQPEVHHSDALTSDGAGWARKVSMLEYFAVKRSDHPLAPDLPQEQHDALDAEPHSEYRRQTLDLAKNPVPGTHIWRGELRAEDPVKGARTTGVGIHWGVNPDTIVRPQAFDGEHEVVYHAEIEHPEEQTFPRSHAMWQGRHMSMDSEAEVRLKPGTKVKLHGVWYRDPYVSEKGYFTPTKPERMGKQWSYTPIGEYVDVAHRPSNGLIDYSDVGVKHEGVLRYFTAAEEDEDYRMQHRPADEEYGAPLHDLTHGGMLPEDVYTHPQYYDYGGEGMGGSFGESYRHILRTRGKPEAKVKIYRSLPAEHAHQGFRPGDWVTTSKEYARQHGRESDPKHDWPVISTTVPAKHLWTEGNDLREYGYTGPHKEMPMVSYKGGYHQEIRTDPEGWIKVVKRRAPKMAMPAKNYPPPEDFSHHIEDLDSTDNDFGKQEEDWPGWHHRILYGKSGGRIGGHIVYSENPKGTAISVGKMETYPSHRGKGLASAMQDALAAEHPSHWINHGSRTGAGRQWWDSYEDPAPDRNIHNVPHEMWEGDYDIGREHDDPRRVFGEDERPRPPGGLKYSDMEGKEGFIGGAVRWRGAEGREDHAMVHDKDNFDHAARADALLNAAQEQGALQHGRWHEDPYEAEEHADELSTKARQGHDDPVTHFIMRKNEDEEFPEIIIRDHKPGTQPDDNRRQRLEDLEYDYHPIHDKLKKSGALLSYFGMAA